MTPTFDTRKPAPAPDLTRGNQRAHATQERCAHVDHARGLSIVLVVLGHVWSGLERRIEVPEMLGPPFEWLWSFRMQFFFFIAGLFLYRSAQKPATRFAADRASRLLWPYLVWCSIYALLQQRPADDLGRILLVEPVAQFWFLHVLLVLSFATLLLVKLRLTPLSILGAAVIAYGTARLGYVEVKPLFQAAMYAPALALGMVLGPPVVKAWPQISRAGAAFMVIIGAATIALIVSQHLSGHLQFDLRTGAAGTIMLIGLVRLIADLRFSPLPALGRSSLEIFLFHILVIVVVRSGLLRIGVDHWAVHMIACTSLALLVPVGVRWLIVRFRIPFITSFPLPREERERPAPMPRVSGVLACER